MADSDNPMDSSGDFIFPLDYHGTNQVIGVGGGDSTTEFDFIMSSTPHPRDMGLMVMESSYDSIGGSTAPYFTQMSGDRFLRFVENQDLQSTDSYGHNRSNLRGIGEGLIMALDSDFQNATGDGGGTGGLTQYWIG